MESTSRNDTFPPLETVDEMGGKPEYVELAKTARDKTKDCLKMYDEDSWKLFRDKRGVTTWTIPTSGSKVPTIKRYMEVEASLQHTLDFLKDNDNANKICKKYIESVCVEKINENNRFEKNVISGVWPIIRKRDTSLFVHQINMEDGRVLFQLFSAEHKDIPETKATRAQCDLCYFELTPISENKTGVGSIIYCDSKGWLSKCFIKAQVEFQHEEFESMKKLIEKGTTK